MTVDIVYATFAGLGVVYVSLFLRTHSTVIALL
jgi:hypothetical protein